MLKIVCSRCGEDAAPEVINVLSGRRYEILCKRCGTKFMVDAKVSGAEKSKENPSNLQK